MPNYLTSIHNYSTEELIDELLEREGVENHTVAPCKEARVTIEGDWWGDSEDAQYEGSARIIVIANERIR